MLSRVLGANDRVHRLRESHYFGGLCDVHGFLTPLSEEKFTALGAAFFARQARGIWGSGPDEKDLERARELCTSVPSGMRTGAEAFVGVTGQLCAERNKTIPCEHTPRNIYYAAELLQAYPEARIVHVVRDPRAVLASQKSRWRQRSMGRSRIPISETIRVWANYHPVTMTRLWVGASRKAIAMESHDRFMWTRFEDVVSRPTERLRELCEFLGIDFQENMLDVPQIGSSHAQNVQSAGISKEAVDRWRKVLTKTEIRVCENIAGDLLEHFSYPRLYPDTRLPIGDRTRMFMRYPLHVCGVIASNPRRAWVQMKALLRPHAWSRPDDTTPDR